MALIFMDGMDSSRYSLRWTSGYVGDYGQGGWVSTGSNFGTGCLRVRMYNNNTIGPEVVGKTSGGGNRLLVGGWMKVDRNDFPFLRVRRYDGASEAVIYRDSSGKISIRQWGGSYSNVAATGTYVWDSNWHWYDIDIVYASGTSGSARVYVDGILDLNVSGISTVSAGTPAVERLALHGHMDNNGYFDDIVWYDDTGTGLTAASFPLGAMKIETIRPSADATAQFARSTGSTNYSLISEATDNGDTNYVEATGAGSQDLYDYTDIGTPTPGYTFDVKAVNLVTVMKNAGGLSVTANNVLKNGATTQVSSDYTLTQQYAAYQTLYEKNPNTGLAWTRDQVNATQLGFRMKQSTVVYAGAPTTWSTTDKTANLTLSNSNLTVTSTAQGENNIRSADFTAAGTTACYFEVVAGTMNDAMIGISGIAYSVSNTAFNSPFVYALQNGGQYYYNGGSLGSIGFTYTSGDVISVAYTDSQIWFRKNGGYWNNTASGDPATGTGGLSHNIYGKKLVLARIYSNGNAYNLRTSPSSWTYAAPTGFLPITTAPNWPSFRTWNPGDKDSGITLTSGNLTATNTLGAGERNVRFSLPATPVSSQKTYIELLPGGTGQDMHLGIAQDREPLNGSYLGRYYAAIMNSGGQIYINGTMTTTLSGMSFTAGDVIGMAFDNTNIWWRKNGGNWNGSALADPATGTGGIAHGQTGELYVGARVYRLNDSVTVRPLSGQWTYTAPSGFSEISGTYL